MTSFKWAVLGFYNFVVSVVGFPSVDSPVVCVGDARERLGSGRVSMKDDENGHKNRGEGGLWRAHGLGSSHQVRSWMSFQELLVSPGCGVSSVSSSSSVLDLPVRGGPHHPYGGVYIESFV